MNKLALVLIVLAPALAHADKSFLTGKGATWDCKADPVVNINHGRGNYTFKGACKTLNLNGGGNTIAIESVDTINVTGGSNTITAGEVGAINLVGSDNKVTWKKAKSGDKPATSVVGTNNKIENAGGGGGGGGGEAAPPPRDRSAPSDKAAPPDAIDCAKQPAHTFNNGDLRLTFVGTCDRIVVNGGENHLTIESVKSLALNGGDNVVDVGGVDRISMNGADNKVTYKKGLSTAKPRISSIGENNTATQVK